MQRRLGKSETKEKMWPFWWKGASGFSARSTAEEVTHGIDGTGLTAIVTGPLLLLLLADVNQLFMIWVCFNLYFFHSLISGF